MDKVSDGVIYKNVIGSYMHGSVLPKNPHLTDFLILSALKNKYNQQIELTQLNDQEEIAAHKAILERYKVAI
jgi:CobQ-like glutamine amidotransferase family enzyme